jgi:hypothetical protein
MESVTTSDVRWEDVSNLPVSETKILQGDSIRLREISVISRVSGDAVQLNWVDLVDKIVGYVEPSVESIRKIQTRHWIWV